MGTIPEDMTGKRYGKLVVLARVAKPEQQKSRGVFWLCRCACGEECTAEARMLRQAKKEHCGCSHKQKAMWSPARDAALRQGWEAGVQLTALYEVICGIPVDGPNPQIQSLSGRAWAMGVKRPEGFQREMLKVAVKPAKVKALKFAKPSRKPAPVMRPAPAPQPVVIAVVAPTPEPLSKEAAWESARQIVSRKRDLSSIDVAEVARLSGMCRFYPRLRQQMALTEIRIVIGQVRAARYEVGGAA